MWTCRVPSRGWNSQVWGFIHWSLGSAVYRAFWELGCRQAPVPDPLVLVLVLTFYFSFLKAK